MECTQAISFRKKDNKHLRKVETGATAKEKKRRQAMQIVRTRKEEALRELEGVTYEASSFWFVSPGQ